VIDLLWAQGRWKYVSGEMCVPRPPIVATSDTFTTPTAHDTRDSNYGFMPESSDTSYPNQFYHFVCDREHWQMNNDKACGLLTSQMESTIHIRYRESSKPKQLWDIIKADFEKVIKLD